MNEHKQTQIIIKPSKVEDKWGKDSLFNKWCWGNWTATCKRMKLEHFLTPYTRVNTKWIKDLNVGPETIQLLEENIGRMLYDLNQNKILYDPFHRVKEIKPKVNNWDLIKLKSFGTPKETISRVINTYIKMLLPENQVLGSRDDRVLVKVS